MIKSDIPYINYIMDIINDIQNSIKSISKNSLEKNKDKKEANIRRIEIISEVVKNISEEFKNKYPYIGWKKLEKIGGMLKYKYFGVDFNTVWDFINGDIPKLKQEIEEIINKEKQVN